MKYPKLWDAGASPIGEGSVRWLERLDMPYAKAVGIDSISYKRPGFNEVHSNPKEIIVDGYYCLGDLGSSSIYVMASATGRGVFKNRGVQGGVLNFALPHLSYAGKGSCFVPAYRAVTNFQEYYSTRNGRDFFYTGINLGPIASDPFGPLGYEMNLEVSGFYGVSIPATDTVPAHTAKTRYSGFTYLYDSDTGSGLEPGLPTYVFTKGGVLTAGVTLTYAGVHVSTPSVQRAGPAKLVSWTVAYSYPLVWDGGTSSYVYPTTSPGAPFFSLSTDAGETWSFIPSGTLFTDLMTLYNACMTGSASPATVFTPTLQLASWRAGVGLMRIGYRGAPLTPTKFCMLVPILDDLLWNTQGFTYHIVTIDGTTLTTHGTLFTKSPTRTVFQLFYYRHETDAGSIDAVYAQTTDGTAHSLWRTLDGTTWTHHATLPFAQYNTGYITFDSPKAMMLPAYDGKYSLYESKDTGLTWTRRATIYPPPTKPDAAPPPAAPAPNVLWNIIRRFGYVDFVRLANAPAVITAQAPWLSDYSKDYVAP